MRVLGSVSARYGMFTIVYFRSASRSRFYERKKRNNIASNLFASGDALPPSGALPSGRRGALCWAVAGDEAVTPRRPRRTRPGRSGRVSDA